MQLCEGHDDMGGSRPRAVRSNCTQCWDMAYHMAPDLGIPYATSDHETMGQQLSHVQYDVYQALYTVMCSPEWYLEHLSDVHLS